MHWRLRGLGSSSKERTGGGHWATAAPQLSYLSPGGKGVLGNSFRVFDAWGIFHDLFAVSEAGGAAVEVVGTPFSAQAPV